MMTLWSCATCGIEFSDSPEPPALCPICSDDRQYLPPGGQRWTTHDEIRIDRSADSAELEPGLLGITVTPSFGIGQRPLLVKTASGNVLWEPSGFFDDALIQTLEQQGGLAAIASSHPHLTGASVSLSHRFGGVPVYWAHDDRRWLQRPDPVIAPWSGTREVLPGLTLVQCGGHFAGSAVLHWAKGAEGRGAILTGDTIRPNTDRQTVSFMRSYPNLIPLPPRSINKIVTALEPFEFDRIYGGFAGQLIAESGKESVRFSADRYIRWLSDEIRDPDEA
jgi:hypothetical protein